MLVFPSQESANTAYTLVALLGGAEELGPLPMGLSKSVHVLRRNADVNDIVNMAAIAGSGGSGARSFPVARHGGFPAARSGCNIRPGASGSLWRRSPHRFRLA